MKHKGLTRLLSLLMAIMVFVPVFPVSAAEHTITPRLQKVIEFAETVLEHGRNVPNSKYPQLFVNSMNMDTYEPNVWKKNGKTYIPAQFMGQQNLMRVFFGLTKLTGNPKYKQTAIDQYNFYFNNFVDENGLIYMGCHAFIDILTGEIVTDGDAYEVKSNNIPYELMYEANPEATIRFIEAMWNGHMYDFEGLRYNRHNYFNTPMGELWNSQYKIDDPYIQCEGVKIPFQSTSNDLIQGAGLIYEKTGDKMPAVWARRILDRYIEIRNPETGLAGGQYGTYSDEEGGDRVYAQFGPELGENALEPTWIDRNTGKNVLGHMPDALLPYYDQTGDETFKDYTISMIESFIKYCYFPDKHKVIGAMLSDGRNLGGMVVPRDGYHGREGSVLPEYGSMYGTMFYGPAYAYTYEQSPIIWDYLRTYAKNEKYGELGTAPGEGVKLDLNTSSTNYYHALAFKYLYDKFKCEDYIKIAQKICDNLIESHFRNGLFSRNARGVNCELDSEVACIIMLVEASALGVDLGVGHTIGNSNIDMEHDGIGRTYETTIYYDDCKRTPATSVTLDREEVSLAVNASKNFNFNDTEGHWAQRQIRQMAASGIMDGRGDGTFAPDDKVTRAEFVKMINAMCGFRDTTAPLINFSDISKNDWFYNDAIIARNAEILDYHITQDTVFGGNEVLTREQMASILVNALQAVKPDEMYEETGCLYNFTDTDDISGWAKKYMDIAYNKRIINGTSNKTLDPKAIVTRAQAACAIKGLENVLLNEDVVALKADVMPENCTNKTLIWTTSDIGVVDVDDNGRLYPMGPGEATVTVKCGDVTDTTKVVVRATEDWMIKKIKIDGVKYDEFEPDKLDYDLDLPIGTTKIPAFEAESFDGTRVLISKPTSIPGKASLYLDKKGGNTTYTINITANKIAYIINEDYNGFAAGTRLMDTKSGKVIWQISENYRDAALIVDKPTFNVTSKSDDDTDPDGETTVTQTSADSSDKCVAIPYNSKYKYLGEIRGRFIADPFNVGTASDGEDTRIVFSFDAMVDGPFNSLNVRLGSTSGGYLWTNKLVYSDSVVFNEKSKSNLAPYEYGKFHNIKMVVDKNSLMTDYYFDGEKILTDQVPISVVPSLDVFMFHMPAGLNAAATIYVDNIKVYEVNYDALENSFEK